jgi:hypothetical protein
MAIGTPEAELWASVLNQAMIEGFHGCAAGNYNFSTENNQAVSFLVAERGDWADSRKRICTVLGIDDHAFVARCKAVFEGGDPPDVPGFDSRRDNKQGIERQRALYRSLMTGKPAPRVERPKPKPVAPPPVEPEDAMADAIFAVMSQPRSSTPIVVNEDGLLYWPVKSSETGTFRGMPLPHKGTKQYRVMRMATRQRGGNLIGFYQCGDDWEDTLRDVAAQYDLDLMMLEGGLPVTEMTGDTRLYLRQRP